MVPASCEWRQGREKKSRPVSHPVEVGTRGQGGVELNRDPWKSPPGRGNSEARGLSGLFQARDWAKPQVLSGGKTTRLMVGFMEESGLIQRAGLAGGRRQAGRTCSHRHGIKCPLTGSRCCPAVHPKLKPVLLRGSLSRPSLAMSSNKLLGLSFFIFSTN